MCVTSAEAHGTRCCDDQGKFSSQQDPTCFPIQRLAKERAHEELGQTCMEFVRTLTDLSQGCPVLKKAAEQVSETLHFPFINYLFIYRIDVHVIEEFQGKYALAQPAIIN